MNFAQTVVGNFLQGFSHQLHSIDEEADGAYECEELKHRKLFMKHFGYGVLISLTDWHFKT